MLRKGLEKPYEVRFVGGRHRRWPGRPAKALLHAAVTREVFRFAPALAGLKSPLSLAREQQGGLQKGGIESPHLREPLHDKRREYPGDSKDLGTQLTTDDNEIRTSVSRPPSGSANTKPAFQLAQIRQKWGNAVEESS